MNKSDVSKGSSNHNKTTGNRTTSMSHVEHSTEDLMSFRKILRTALLVTGSVKIAFAMYYVSMFLLILFFSSGVASIILQIMTLIAVVPMLVMGVTLIMGVLKAFAMYYVSMFLLILFFSSGVASIILQIMTLIAVVPMLVMGVTLIMGVLKDSQIMFTISSCTALITMLYNIGWGVFGAVYFIRVGSAGVHFVLAAIFISLIICAIPDFLLDVSIIYTYKTIISTLSS